MRYRGIIQSTVQWMLILVACLLLLEGGLHLYLFGFAPKPDLLVPATGGTLYHPLTWRLESGTDRTTSYLNPMQRDWTHSWSVNREGYRGDPVTRASRPVVVLGDSFAFGAGVNDDECFPSVLADMLGGMEVANLGVPGYNTPQEVEWFLRLGVDLNPRAVVLGYGVRDWEPNLFGSTWEVRLARWSNVYAVLKYLSMAGQEAGDPRIREGMPRVFQALDRLHDECGDIDAALLVAALYPGPGVNLLGAWCAERGIRFVDLSRNYGKPGMVIPDDGHPTAEAHFVYAAQTAWALNGLGISETGGRGLASLARALRDAGQEKAARQVEKESARRRTGVNFGTDSLPSGRVSPPSP
ncbi:MAG: SGNH/GDSL hydrolase family protein [Desulfatibacillaceae bacterium]